MLDFLGYAFFSGFEYISILFVTCCFFNLNFRLFIKEIVLVSVLLTIVTYAVIVNSLMTVIPIPLIVLVSFVGLFMITLGKHRWKYSIVISIVGLVFNLLLQIGITILFVNFNIVSESTMGDPFSANTFIMQTLCSSLTIIIGIYTRIVGNGFGFMLRKGKVLSFLGTTITLFSILFTCWLSYKLSETLSVILMLGIVSAVCLIICLILSRQRDKYEFS